MSDRQPPQRAGILLFKMPELQRESLREILASQTDFELLANVSSAQELKAFAAAQSSHLVTFAVCDEVTGELCRTLPNARVVQITPDGRRAIVGRQVSTDDIADAIRAEVGSTPKRQAQ